MAWTVPRDWVRNENITASLLNTHLRDNLNFLYLVTARQTSDLVKNADTTLANLSGLSFSVLSGEVWAFIAFSFSAGLAAADIKYAVTAPGATTGRYGLAGPGIPLTAGSTTTWGGEVAMTVTSLQTNAIVTGYLTAGGNGTIQIQAAQNTSDASDTTFYANSFLVAARVS